MAWYAYCIAERQAFPELCRHRRPMPLTGVTGLFGNQTFLFPASELAIVVSEHNHPDDTVRMDQQAQKDHARVIAWDQTDAIRGHCCTQQFFSNHGVRRI